MLGRVVALKIEVHESPFNLIEALQFDLQHVQNSIKFNQIQNRSPGEDKGISVIVNNIIGTGWWMNTHKAIPQIHE